MSEEIILEIDIPASVAPFMEAHSKRASALIIEFLEDVDPIDIKLGALSVLSLLTQSLMDALNKAQVARFRCGRPVDGGAA